MKIEYEATLKDIVNTELIQHKNSRACRRWLLIFQVGLFAVLGVFVPIIAWTIILVYWPEEWLFALLLNFAASTVSIFAALLIIPEVYWDYVKDCLKYRARATWEGLLPVHFSVEISADEICIVCYQWETTCAWDNVIKVVNGRSNVEFHCRDGAIFVVAKRAFESESHLRRFLDQVSQFRNQPQKLDLPKMIQPPTTAIAEARHKTGIAVNPLPWTDQESTGTSFAWDISAEVVLDYHFRHRDRNLSPANLASVIDRLIGSTEKNGNAIAKVCESWLQSEDRNKVEIILEMTDSFPITDKEKLNSLLSSITERWPDLEFKCQRVKNKFETH